jgi:hypothetical protein
MTPLQANAAYGRSEIVKLLLRFGADPLRRSDDGFHALHLARNAPGVEEILRASVGDRLRLAPSHVVHKSDPVSLVSAARMGTDKIVTVRHPNVLTVWDTTTPTPRSRGVSVDGVRICGVDVAWDGRFVLLSVYWTGVEMRSLADPGLVTRVFRFDGVDGPVAIHPSNSFAAARVAHEEIAIFSLVSGEVTGIVDGGEYTPCLEWSPGGDTLVAIAGHQGGSRLFLHRVDDAGTPFAQTEIETDSISTMHYGTACSPDGRFVALWEADNMQETAPVGYRGRLVCAHMSGERLWSLTVDASLTGNAASAADAGFLGVRGPRPAWSADGDRIGISVDRCFIEVDARSGTVSRIAKILNRRAPTMWLRGARRWIVAGDRGLELVGS